MVTSKDVAQRAGVSHATASRAFSDPDMVSEKTLKKVLKAAEELDYIPNSLASSLKSSQPTSVGFIISNIRNNFFTDIAYRLQKQLYMLERNFMIGLSDESVEEELKCMISQISHRASVILFTPSAYSKAIETKIKRSHGVRFLQLFRNCYSDVDSLIVNDRKGTERAVEIFLEKGYKRILLLDGASALPTYRKEGYADAFEKAGRKADERFIHSLPLQGEVTEEIAAYLDELKPDAVIAVSEFLTSKTVETLKRKGISIGKDIGFVAYDDSLTAQALGITAIGHDEELIISEIQNLMCRAMAGQEPGVHKVIEPTVIERDSVL